MDGSSIVAIVASVALGVSLILMLKKQVIDPEVLTGTAEVLQGLPVQEGSGVFGLLLKYAATAVLTVEQLVQTGKIGKTDEERKTEALDIVRKAAEVDGIEYGEKEEIIASACIEAKVQQLPRNQPVSGEGVPVNLIVKNEAPGDIKAPPDAE